jgi:hypothetical protein
VASASARVLIVISSASPRQLKPVRALVVHAISEFLSEHERMFISALVSDCTLNRIALQRLGTFSPLIPAKAGIQFCQATSHLALGPRFRGDERREC